MGLPTKWIVVISVAASVITIAAVTSLIIIVTQDDEIYGLVDWDEDQYRGEIPPEPQFNSSDNAECIGKVEEFFRSASGTYQSA